MTLIIPIYKCPIKVILLIWTCFQVYRKNLFSFISDIKKDGYLILGTDVNNGIDVRDIEVPSKYAFVIGNEGNGVSDKVSSLCDKNLYININNKCESLNASVAASIIMYELNSK